MFVPKKAHLAYVSSLPSLMIHLHLHRSDSSFCMVLINNSRRITMCWGVCQTSTCPTPPWHWPHHRRLTMQWYDIGSPPRGHMNEVWLNVWMSSFQARGADAWGLCLYCLWLHALGCMWLPRHFMAGLNLCSFIFRSLSWSGVCQGRLMLHCLGISFLQRGIVIDTINQ